MDALQQSALAFEKLQKYEYEITAGSRKTLLEMTLYFSREHFMHLIGLHKLIDLQLQRYNKERMYDLIIEGSITYDYIKKSQFFCEIEERVRMFPLLEEALDSNELLIKYKPGFVRGTIISASYILLYQYRETTLHYFVDMEKDTGKYFGKSFFGRNDDKYVRNQQTFKILKKVKHNTETGNQLLLLDKPVKK